MRKNVHGLKEYMFIIPTLAGISFFVFLPFADVVRRSFTDVAGKRFIGFQSYQAVFANEAFRLAAGNSLRFLLVCVPLLLGLSLLLAHIIWSGMAKFCKYVCLLPMAVPAVSLVFVWNMAFHRNGFINSYLGLSADWLNTSCAFWVLVASFLWKNIGYYVVLWLAGLEKIPQSYYDAAAVDGAGAFDRFRYITLPGLIPMFSAAFILAVTGTLKSYRECYLLAGEYPHQSIYMMQHLFHNWFREMAVDKMSASAVMAVCLFMVIVYPFRKKGGGDPGSFHN